MHDSDSILPLLDPNSNNYQLRRKKTKLQPSDLLRCLTRRCLKIYIVATVLVLLFCLTFLYKTNRVDVANQKQQLQNDKRARFEARTMRTIIGKYVGPKLDVNAYNLSNEILNSNNYDPDRNLGKDGRPVYLPGYPKNQMQALYSINRFNLAVSDKISVDRKLPEGRKLSCRKFKYDLSTLPSTSVIIVFHNEAWSTLVRTVHSILNTADRSLLREILLVDDASERTFLGKSLDYYMNNLSSVQSVDIKVLRSSQRIGLIRSRLIGVKAARGKVLTFIDAHCEATVGWLEPLLEQVRQDPYSAACPIIDIINEDNFAYTRSFELHHGAFNWGLNFRWYPISRRELIASNMANASSSKENKTNIEFVRPFSTPIMAGGLFSINRDYFEQIGLYDPQMDIWGGENIELSLRLWQCGGRVKIVPCSHVAHIFRKSSPYTFRPGKEVGDILYTNLARLAEVWMDEWRDFFLAVNPIVNKTLDKVGRAMAFAQIDERKRLRERLGCKSFRWFLDNVWPEHFFPTHEVGRFFGQIKLAYSNRCLRRPPVRPGSGQAPVGPLSSANCTSNEQQVLLSTDQLFIYNLQSGSLMSDENVCLDSGSSPMPTRQVILAPCSESERQKWHYDEKNHIMRHKVSRLCLASPRPDRVQLENCDERNNSLKWLFEPVKWTNKTLEGPF